MFGARIVTFDQYLFQLTVIANVLSLYEAVLNAITQFLDQVAIRLISQLIKGISRVLQKLAF